MTTHADGMAAVLSWLMGADGMAGADCEGKVDGWGTIKLGGCGGAVAGAEELAWLLRIRLLSFAVASHLANQQPWQTRIPEGSCWLQ